MAEKSLRLEITFPVDEGSWQKEKELRVFLVEWRSHAISGKRPMSSEKEFCLYAGGDSQDKMYCT